MENLNNKWTNYLDEVLKAGVPIYYTDKEGNLIEEKPKVSTEQLKEEDKKIAAELVREAQELEMGY